MDKPYGEVEVKLVKVLDTNIYSVRSTKLSSEYAKMERELRAECSLHSIQNEYFLPQLNQIVAWHVSEDLWCRAKILKIHKRKGDMLCILYAIDRGYFKEDVSIVDVKPLPEKNAEMSPFAKLIVLYDILPQAERNRKEDMALVEKLFFCSVEVTRIRPMIKKTVDSIDVWFCHIKFRTYDGEVTTLKNWLECRKIVKQVKFEEHVPDLIRIVSALVGDKDRRKSAERMNEIAMKAVSGLNRAAAINVAQGKISELVNDKSVDRLNKRLELTENRVASQDKISAIHQKSEHLMNGATSINVSQDKLSVLVGDNNRRKSKEKKMNEIAKKAISLLNGATTVNVSQETSEFVGDNDRRKSLVDRLNKNLKLTENGVNETSPATTSQDNISAMVGDKCHQKSEQFVNGATSINVSQNKIRALIGNNDHWKNMERQNKQPVNTCTADSVSQNKNQQIAEAQSRYLMDQLQIDKSCRLQVKKPTVFWSQDADYVYLYIKLDSNEYQLKFDLNKIEFHCEMNDSLYEFSIILSASVMPERCEHRKSGVDIYVKLKKLVKGLDWPKLLHSNEKMLWIKVNHDVERCSKDRMDRHIEESLQYRPEPGNYDPKKYPNIVDFTDEESDSNEENSEPIDSDAESRWTETRTVSDFEDGDDAFGYCKSDYVDNNVSERSSLQQLTYNHNDERKLENIDSNRINAIGRSRTVKTITLPDGRVQVETVTRDSKGNVEKRVTYQKDDKQYTIITRRDPSGVENVEQQVTDIDQAAISRSVDDLFTPFTPNVPSDSGYDYWFDKFFSTPKGNNENSNKDAMPFNDPTLPMDEQIEKLIKQFGSKGFFDPFSNVFRGFNPSPFGENEDDGSKSSDFNSTFEDEAKKIFENMEKGAKAQKKKTWKFSNGEDFGRKHEVPRSTRKQVDQFLKNFATQRSPPSMFEKFAERALVELPREKTPLDRFIELDDVEQSRSKAIRNETSTFMKKVDDFISQRQIEESSGSVYSDIKSGEESLNILAPSDERPHASSMFPDMNAILRKSLDSNLFSGGGTLQASETRLPNGRRRIKTVKRDKQGNTEIMITYEMNDKSYTIIEKTDAHGNKKKQHRQVNISSQEELEEFKKKWEEKFQSDFRD